jgi:hypothetical protein
MANTCQIGTSLPAGTYWVEFSALGSLASGPFAVPITRLGDAITGNALQWQTSVWVALEDSGASAAQGIPFTVTGYKQ